MWYAVVCGGLVDVGNCVGDGDGGSDVGDGGCYRGG